MIIDIVTDLHGMVEVNFVSFLEVELLSRDATESKDQSVHGHHQLHGDVVPHIASKYPHFCAPVACKDHIQRMVMNCPNMAGCWPEPRLPLLITLNMIEQ
jgi:hypothetical protein